MTAAQAPRFASLVLDVDSTLCALEGIDWLAARRGAAVERQVERLTEQAMAGAVPLDAVYGERLALVRPSPADVDALAAAYADAIAPRAFETVTRLRDAGVRVVLVSGGIRGAILPLATSLGIADADLAAVRIRFTASGDYAGFDTDSPLTTSAGKAATVEALSLPRPTLAVGDGSTDVAMRSAVDAFAAYVGVVRRQRVVAAADHVVSSFDEIAALVLGG